MHPYISGCTAVWLHTQHRKWLAGYTVKQGRVSYAAPMVSYSHRRISRRFCAMTPLEAVSNTLVLQYSLQAVLLS